MKKILSVTTHMAQNYGGLVAGTINSEKHNLEITQTEFGVQVYRAPNPEGSKGCNKLVSWANILCIDYYFDDGKAPVVGTGTVS